MGMPAYTKEIIWTWQNISGHVMNLATSKCCCHKHAHVHTVPPHPAAGQIGTNARDKVNKKKQTYKHCNPGTEFPRYTEICIFVLSNLLLDKTCTKTSGGESDVATRELLHFLILEATFESDVFLGVCIVQEEIKLCMLFCGCDP